MKRKICLFLSVFLSNFAFADSSTGMYVGASGGWGLTNDSSTNPNGDFNATNDFAYRVDFGAKIDTYFGVEAGYVAPSISNNNWLGDVYLNYYMNTDSKWDVIFGLGPYYASSLSAVGVAGNFGVNYNFSKSTSITFGEYLYINPQVPANQGGNISSYLQNNVTTLGLRVLL